MATQSYMTRLIAAIRDLFREKPVPTQDDIDAVTKRERARAGGLTASANRKAKDAEDDAAKVAAADTPAEPVNLAEWATLSHNERDRAVREALSARFGPVAVMDVWDDYAVYFQTSPTASMMDAPDRLRFFRVDYKVNSAGEFEFGERTEVEEQRAFVPVQAGDAPGDVLLASHFVVPGKSGGRAVPQNVAALPDKQQRQWAEIWNSAYDRAIKGGKSEAEAVAAAFAQANGVVKVKKVAAGDAPAAVALSSPEEEAQRNGRDAYTLVHLREEGQPLPEWIQVHKVGYWAVEHAGAGRIELTEERADELISNFGRGVLRRGVPLQEGHDTGAKAFGWIVELRRGGVDEGKTPDNPPSGSGSVIYGRVRYNATGRAELGDETYCYVSPGYDRDYVDKETGAGPYGFVLLHVAALNDPYLRLRSIQGEDAPEPVMLADAVVRASNTGGDAMSVTLEEMNAVRAELAEVKARADRDAAALNAEREQLAAERAERHRDRVAALADAAIDRGVPPAAVNIVRAVMLASSPAAEGVILLGEGDGAPKVNAYDAMTQLLDVIPRLQLGAVTRPTELRPRTDGMAALADDEKVREQAKALGARVRGTEPTKLAI